MKYTKLCRSFRCNPLTCNSIDLKDMKRYIVGIGDALWDCLPEGRKIGGAPANFAYYMTQFGFDSLAVSAIGDDPLGDEIKETFDKIGLKYSLEVTEYPTGTHLCFIKEKAMATHSSTLGWKVPWTEEPGRLQSMVSLGVGHD